MKHNFCTCVYDDLYVFEDDWQHQGTTYCIALGIGPRLFLAHMPFVCTYIRYCTVYSLYVGTTSVGTATCDLIDCTYHIRGLYIMTDLMCIMT